MSPAIANHQARCLPHLIGLQMLAQGEAGVPLPPWAAAEVARTTGAILTETEAASRAALTSPALFRQRAAADDLRRDRPRDVGIRPSGYLTAVVVTIGLWMVLAPAIGATDRAGKPGPPEPASRS